MRPGLHLFCLMAALLNLSETVSGAPAAPGVPAKGNRLVYLDGSDPFYVHGGFPRLVTAQWVGEPGVEAVATLGVDDMRDTAKYEAYLRPILDRLKARTGAAPVSILTVRVNPEDPALPAWLREGLSFDVHTLTHPCPLLQKGNFEQAANVVHGGVDLLSQIPGNHPVAYRMPCCDSMNSPSPRFFAEIFNRVSQGGRFLQMDTSVMNRSTAKDRALPRDWVVDASGRDRFAAYFPATTNAVTRKSLAGFATTIEDYPYPYIIGGLCWEMPPMVPSDWEAFNVRGANHETTLADMKTAVDIAVLKGGVYNLIFHPHGWIRNDQVVELIDHALDRHAGKIRFLTFPQVADRLTRNLLAGEPLRNAQGGDNGVRLLDLDGDGFQDVVIGNARKQLTRVWNPAVGQWREFPFPARLVRGNRPGPERGRRGRFGLVGSPARVTLLLRDETEAGAWQWSEKGWVAVPELLQGLNLKGRPVYTSWEGRDQGVRLRDVDGDGSCELVVGNPGQNAVFRWNPDAGKWAEADFHLPEGTRIVDEKGRDAGLRFVDVNRDGFDDVLFSDATRWSLHLYVKNPVPRLGWYPGWSHEARSGLRGEAGEIPAVVRDGEASNNGAWFLEDAMVVQNEDTAALPDQVRRLSFETMLARPVPAPLEPAEALKSMVVEAGFEVELVAAEPLIRDPVAFDWDAQGRLWVVEMRDYPLGLDGKGRPGGSIRILEDTDRDGTYDQARVFLEDIPFPTGLHPWREGVLVSAAPRIFFAADENGDGTADRQKSLFTGFREGNQQHRVNGFQYGLDHWIYGANGDSGGRIISLGGLGGEAVRQRGLTIRAGEDPVDINGRDFRFRPDSGEFEARSGRTQFGRYRDDWGNWFGNNNPNWLWHYHLPEHYLKRNPDLAVRSTRRLLAQYEGGTRVYPQSRTVTRWNQPHSANHVTSANSPSPYRDDGFGPGFRTSVFISEPVHNVVHREVLEPEGVSFRSHRAAGGETTEFLASTDSWFRPTMIKTGPDGALYVADFYRFVLEHPEWISPEAQAAVNVRMGDDKGRIYRVRPREGVRRGIPDLSRLQGPDLARALNSRNGWQRDTVQRLIVERADRSAAAVLRGLVAEAPDARVRLQALWTLSGLKQLTPKETVAGLRDAHPGVRSQTLVLTEAWLKPVPAVRLPGGAVLQSAAASLGKKELGSLHAAILERVQDPDPKVRFQLAFTLGEWPDSRAGEALARLAGEAEDPDFQTAILSSARPHLGSICSRITTPDGTPSMPTGFLRRLWPVVLGTGNGSLLNQALEGLARAGDGPWRMDALAGFLEALGEKRRNWPSLEVPGDSIRLRVVKTLEGSLRHAATVVEDPKNSLETKVRAVSLLGWVPETEAMDRGLLLRLLDARQPDVLAAAAMDRLSRLGGAALPQDLLERWPALSGGTRNAVLETLLRRVDFTKGLLEGLEAGRPVPGELNPAQRQKLLSHRDSEIRGRARQVLEAARLDRAALLRNYRPALRLTGDLVAGASLFAQHCQTCHRFRGQGFAVGPDLESLSDGTVEDVLVAVLDPNAAIEETFVGYTAVSKDGREWSGVLGAETASSITLRMANGQEQTILRSDLEALTASGLSLMPEGFEQLLKPQDVADLAAFILQGGDRASR